MGNLVGTVKRVIYSKDDFNICLVSIDDDDKNDLKCLDMVVSVYHPNIKKDFKGDFSGDFEVNGKYGKQFKAKYVIEELPSTSKGFKNYLKSGLFKGIGEVTANKIVDFLGENPISKLKKDPNIILSVPSVKKVLLEGIKETWLSNSVKGEIMVLLQQNGVSGANLDKIYQRFGERSISVITKNPYILISQIDGIGFKMADKIAINMGLGENSEARYAECMKYILDSDTNYGSCYLTKKQLINRVWDLIARNDLEVIDSALSSEGFKILNIDGEDRYYSIKLYNAEQKVVNILKDMMLQQTMAFETRSVNDETLTNEQKLAVIGALSNKISILTGGPGCGKTYTTKTIVDNLLHLNKTVSICAPTGKAASRSSEVIGQEAVTIHRLLKFDFKTNKFTVNHENPIEADYLIVEESSMIDITLMSDLLDSIPPECQVLFVGDHEQLPPIGPGSPFRDMIESEVLPIYVLNKIFRQGLNSDIVKTAHAISSGKSLKLSSPLSNPEIWKGDTDFMFIDSDLNDGRRPSDFPKESTLHYNMDITKMVIKLYTDTIKKYRGISDVQILIPKRVGVVGCDNINLTIQEAVNPGTANQILLKSGKRFRLNDKVIHVKNNYDLEVFNGEIGKIIKIDGKKNECVVSYENKVVNYSTSDLKQLELAFAITIHKSQGSEFGCVIMPIITEHTHMLDRSLIYTGITRAKKLGIVIGKKRSFYQGVATIRNNKTQTSLKELIKTEEEETKLELFDQ